MCSTDKTLNLLKIIIRDVEFNLISLEVLHIRRRFAMGNRLQ